MTKNVSPITFIDRVVKKNELGQPFKLMDHQREILRLAFAFDENGRLPWDTIIYSCVKKSGKTTLNGAITLAWGFVMESPNEILVLANDLEQTLARVFKTMEGLIKFNPELQPEAEIQAKQIFLANGTTITAISGDYAGAAGSNHGLVSYDEMWGYISESSTRLWEELTPVPTRKNSIRFISTYAGFEGESKLLWDLYKQVVSKDEHPEGQGERIHPDLPIFANRKARLFAYWDHEPRMPWQTEEYYDSQKRTLRPGAYLRFHRNQWATAEEVFIKPEMWDPNVDHSRHPTMTREPLFVGVDVGIKHDNAARVAVRWDDAGEKLILVSHRIWKPTPTQPLNLEDTVEEDLLNLNEQSDLVEALVDPYQMHRSISTLQAASLPIREFPQTQANCTLMGQILFDLLNGRNLILYADAELRQQALSTVAIENPRGWRIAKEKASKKIDAIVALAMACCAAMAHRGEIGKRAARGFSRAHHVSKERLKPFLGRPLFVGQTFVDCPATVLGQVDRGGQIRILAAFVSEGMSLRRHLEESVKPWLSANVRGATLLGGYEETDPRLSSDMRKTINEILGAGEWTMIRKPWESRRDAMLDVLGKATAYSFRPILQIDPVDARPLIEALSGRWSFEKERRDMKNASWYVANSFGLLIARSELWKAPASPPVAQRVGPGWMSA